MLALTLGLIWSAAAPALAAPAASAEARAAGPAGSASADGWQVALTRHYGTARDASGYSAVVSPGRLDVWAFGGTNPGGASIPVAMHWTGTRWQPWPLPRGLSGFIGDASAPSSRDIWAVSYGGGYILHWNGKHWSVARRWRDHDVATGVTALGPADVWVFGTTVTGAHGTGTWHFNGHAWSRVTGLAGHIHRASGVSGRDLWAVAATRHGGLIEHYNGHRWRRVGSGATLAGASLDDVLARSARSVWVVGNLHARRGEGKLVVAHYDGRRWHSTRTRWLADTSRLAPDGAGGVWITADNVGNSGQALIGHLLDGHLSWTMVRHDQGSGISDVTTSASGRVWASGGVLTQAGGDAVVWSHRAIQRPRQPGLREITGRQIRPAVPLAAGSWRLDLTALLWRAQPAAIT